MFARFALAFVYTLAPVAIGGSRPGGDEPVAPVAPATPATNEPALTEPGRVDAPALETPAKAQTPEKDGPGDVECAVPFPHPIITEVLFAVPVGDVGDANGDGKRHVSGDEFVELYNPHGKAIQLRGYKLTDSTPADKGQLRFVFPTLELSPGARVVVFNGFQCSWFGPVGDEKAAASAGNERFEGAWVFTMKAASQYVAFSNSGDHVLLTAPDGTAVHRVSWGEAKDQAAFDKVSPLVDDQAMQASKASVQRDSLSRVASFRAHTDLPFAHGGDKPFSPGVWSPLPEPKAKKKVEEGEEDQPEQGEEGEGREEGEKK